VIGVSPESTRARLCQRPGGIRLRGWCARRRHRWRWKHQL